MIRSVEERRKNIPETLRNNGIIIDKEWRNMEIDNLMKMGYNKPEAQEIVRRMGNQMTNYRMIRNLMLQDVYGRETIREPGLESSRIGYMCAKFPIMKYLPYIGKAKWVKFTREEFENWEEAYIKRYGDFEM